MNYKQKVAEFKKLLEGFDKVTLLVHKKPDGDTICSAIALYEALKKELKKIELVSFDKELPKEYSFLPAFQKFKHKIDFNDSLIITLDSASIDRVGFDISKRVIVNIDHHKSNTSFGTLNIVEELSATALVVFKLLEAGFTINAESAKALYAGIISDNQNFTTSLTQKEDFLVAAKLIDFGIDPTSIAIFVNKSKSLAHFRLKSYAMNAMELCCDAKVAIMSITEEDLQKSGAKSSDIDGIIDEAIALKVVEAAFLIYPYHNFFKVSIRSKNEDISKMALAFGGGGHKSAAGFEVKNGTIGQIKEDIIKYIKEHFQWQDELGDDQEEKEG